MYPYHNRIKQRINNGELIGWQHYTHKTIGKCILLLFKTPPFTRPIRPTAFYKYQEIFDNYKEIK